MEKPDTHVFDELEEKYPSLKGVSEKLRENVMPWFEGQEGRRREAVKHRVKGWAITGVAGLIALVLFVMFVVPIHDDNEILGNILALVEMGVVGGLAVWAEEPAKKLKRDMKLELVRMICEQMNLERVGRLQKDPVIFREMQLVPDYIECRLRDVFSGSYHGVSFMMAFTEMLKGTKKEPKTTFSGILIMIGFPAPFFGKTKILRDKGSIGNMKENRKVEEQRVNLAYTEFEKMFEVYSTDQVEARNILTPDILESLIKIRDLAPGAKWMQAGYVGPLMLIAIQSKQTKIEVGALHKSMSDTGRITKFIEEVALIHKVIEVMNLNIKTAKAQRKVV